MWLCSAQPAALYRHWIYRIIWEVVWCWFFEIYNQTHMQTHTHTQTSYIRTSSQKVRCDYLIYSALMNDNGNVNGSGNDNRIQQQINATEHTQTQHTIQFGMFCACVLSTFEPFVMEWLEPFNIFVCLYCLNVISSLSFHSVIFSSSSSRIHIHICNVFISKWYVHSVELNLLRLKSLWIRTMIKWCMNLIWFDSFIRSFVVRSLSFLLLLLCAFFH